MSVSFVIAPNYGSQYWKELDFYQELICPDKGLCKW